VPQAETGYPGGMSEQARIHGHGTDDDDDEPLNRDLTGDVPTAPDPDLAPGGTKDVQDPPGHEEISDLPR
jgi:hypothetical protein